MKKLTLAAFAAALTFAAPMANISAFAGSATPAAVCCCGAKCACSNCNCAEKNCSADKAKCDSCCSGNKGGCTSSCCAK